MAEPNFEDHPDFPEMLRLAQEEVWGELVPSFDRAVGQGNRGEAERLRLSVDGLARDRARQILSTMSRVDMDAVVDTGQPPGNAQPPPSSTFQPDPQFMRGFERATRVPQTRRREPALLDAPPPRVPPPLGLDYGETPGIPSPFAGDLDPAEVRTAAERHRSPGVRLPLPDLMPPPANEIGSTIFHRDDVVNPDPRTNALTERDDSGLSGLAPYAALLGLPYLPYAAGPLAGGAAWLGRAARAAPRTAGATIAGGTTVLGTGQTQTNPAEPENVVAARTRAAESRRVLTETQDLVKSLTASVERLNPERIERLTPQERDPEVRAIQRELSRITDAKGRPLYNPGVRDGNIDGVWGGLTTTAAGIRRAQLQAELNKARTALAAARGREERDDTALQNIIGTANYQSAERRMPWYGWLAREYGTPISIAGGALLGAGGRALNSWRINAANRAAVRDADALINPAGTLNERAVGVSNFYERGGGTRPFRVDTTSPHGFVPQGNQTMGENLFRARPSWIRQRVDPVDVGAMLTVGGVAGRAEFLVLPEARRELESARAAYQANRSPENAERLTRAEGSYATALVMARGGLGALGGYLGASFRPRQFPRPDVNRAGQEVLNLNAIVRPPPRPVTWSSPAGPNNPRARTLTQDPATRLFTDSRGSSFTETDLLAKGWRRNP